MYALRYGDTLPGSVGDELDSMSAELDAVMNQEHVSNTGEHTNITVDSISSRDAAPIPIYNGLRLLSGPLFLDPLGNTGNVARISPPQITANQNDYNPVGLSTAIVLELTSDAARNITGIQITGRQQRLLILGNTGSFNITLVDASASSVAQNRFEFPANVVVAPSEYVILYYVTSDERWHRIG
jgi:hypothetical protein